MSKCMSLMASTAFIMSAGAAVADLTAPDLWAEWQELQQALGTTITAQSVNYAGGVLTLTNVATQAIIDEVESTGRIAQITLREQGDGSVRIELAPVYALGITDTSFGESMVTTMELRHTGLDIVARDEDGARIYDYGAQQLTLDVGDVVVDGETMPVQVSLTVNDLASRYVIDMGSEARPFQSQDAIGAMQIQFSMSDPTEGTFSMQSDFTNLTSAFSGTLNAADGALPLGPLGVALKGELTHGGSSVQFAAEASDGDIQMNARTGAGTLAIDIDPTKFGIFSDTTQTEIRTLIGGFPFPVEASVGRSTFGIAMPIARTDDPAPVNLTLGLRDVVLSDVIWGLFDPQGIIPRDPATIALDIEGTATVLSDLMDVTNDFKAVQGPPAQINSLRLNDLEVSLGGAQLSGTGAATFDNSSAIPAPVGRINLSLIGGFGLLDQLATLGVVPPEKVGMVRMMSGMFATPTGPDELASEIEFLEDGSILVNGFPLQ